MRELKALKLDRPLVFFDIEATGLVPETDRIVEIAFVRLRGDVGRTYDSTSTRINPEEPIPPESTAIHGITDADVADSPTFRDRADGIYKFIKGADLAGYNIKRFDVPILRAELARAGIKWDPSENRVLDVFSLYCALEPRDLSTIVQRVLGRDHDDAHGALADTTATVEILDAIAAGYDIPGDVETLIGRAAQKSDGWVDSTRKFIWRFGEAVTMFGKHKGTKLSDLPNGYLNWMAKDAGDFSQEVRDIAADAIEKKYPTRTD